MSQIRPKECKGCKCWECGNIFCPQWLVCRPETCKPKIDEECEKYCDSASEG